MNLDKIKKLDIPKTPGCYQFYSGQGKIIYIGKAADLRSRVFSYWRLSAGHTPMKLKMLKEIEKVKWLETETEIEALLLEANLIKKYQPEYNVLMRDDKRYAYVKISLEDDIPGVFITRKIDKTGRYFGPFTRTEAIRETLKAIRKIWPYCTEKKIKLKPCFYAQIGRCTGVCGGLYDPKEYREKIIKPIILLFTGKKNKIIKNLEKAVKNWKLEIGNLPSNSKKREEIDADIKSAGLKLKNLKYILDNTKILSLTDKYAADVVELAKVLNLPAVPAKIEGYDISNIFGREAVGSMVVFKDGEPDKSGYRKFKIKIGQGEANDVRMLREVLERRLKRAREAEKGNRAWSLPDLVVVDGGKAQLNAAMIVLRRHKLKLLVIAISKGRSLRSSQARDKIFFPGEKKPLELPLSSPALHIVKRVRDEAHRFAISYHQYLRKKRTIEA